MYHQDSEGPCKDIDVEATKLLHQFKGLCSTVQQDIRAGRLVICDKELKSADIDKAGKTLSSILFKSWETKL